MNGGFKVARHTHTYCGQAMPRRQLGEQGEMRCGRLVDWRNDFWVQRSIKLWPYHNIITGGITVISQRKCLTHKDLLASDPIVTMVPQYDRDG